MLPTVSHAAGAASEGYGVDAKAARGGNTLPCVSSCHTAQRGNLPCGFGFERKAGECCASSPCWCMGAERRGGVAPCLGGFPDADAQLE